MRIFEKRSSAAKLAAENLLGSKLNMLAGFKLLLFMLDAAILKIRPPHIQDKCAEGNMILSVNGLSN